MATSPSNEGTVSLAIQTAAATPNTDVLKLLFTRFNWTPDIVQDEEGEPEIGAGMDVSAPERYGHRGAIISGEGRVRPGHLGLLFRMFGMQAQSGGFIFWDGVNDTISVTDDGGGPTTVDVITSGGAVAGTAYSATEVCTILKTALDAVMSDTYTVTYATGKFTIASDGSSTLSLHWTTTPMMANLLGYEHGADDTGAFTYEADETRYPVGRWQFRNGTNDVIRVTDDGGGPVDVDILSSTGYKLSGSGSYNAWNVCGALKAVLDADTTLSQTYTVTYDQDDNKFTIENGGATLSLHWSHANSNLETDLGFDSTADDTGATTYTSDNAIQPAPKHRFTPYAASSSFPVGFILDEMDPDHNLDTALVDVQMNTIGLNFPSRDVARFTCEGRALSFRDGYESGTGTGASNSFTDSTKDWMTDQWENFKLTDSASTTFTITSNTATVLTVSGTPASGTYTIGVNSETNDSSSVRVPNTSKGSLSFGGGSYCMNALNVQLNWGETVVECLTEAEPSEIIPQRRGGSGSADIYLGSESDAGVFRATYYGSATAGKPSTEIVQRALDALFESGVSLSTTGTTEAYGIRFEAAECHMMAYPLEKSGDEPEMAALAFRITKETTDWGITLITDEQYVYGYYD